MVPLFFQDKIQLTQLRQSDGGLQFADAEVVAQYGVIVQASIVGNVIMAVVGVIIRPTIERFVIRNNRSALSTGNGLDRIERKTCCWYRKT